MIQKSLMVLAILTESSSGVGVSWRMPHFCFWSWKLNLLMLYLYHKRFILLATEEPLASFSILSPATVTLCSRMCQDEHWSNCNVCTSPSSSAVTLASCGVPCEIQDSDTHIQGLTWERSFLHDRHATLDQTRQSVAVSMCPYSGKASYHKWEVRWYGV